MIRSPISASGSKEAIQQAQTAQLMAVDCCEHVVAALSRIVPSSQVSAVSSTSDAAVTKHKSLDLIVIGVTQYPMRRLFISQLRGIYPDVPLLVLRREADSSEPDTAQCIRGEFLLSDSGRSEDYKLVEALRRFLPLTPCEHMHKGHNYDIVREVLSVIDARYSDPKLDLTHVAQAVPISPAHLSRILNQEVGVSFRELLRHKRIEEAKRMLISRHYSVKEVAARVGFSDSHYFSRSFKELTGLSASEYRSNTAIFS
ncbi:MAG TPA: helix-turn-helix transcriptional regulator [Pyrinomonadaceae bacterium]|nr:helix-turn-helix transcriptional regulator [Pyrinomonadaceae bacterium]